MPNFKYKARDKFAKLVSGTVMAASRPEAVKMLQEMGYVVVEISEPFEFNPAEILKKFNRVKLEELSTFTRQLYSMQKAGLPLLSGLETVAQQTQNHHFRIVIEDIARNIRAGTSFSAALKTHNQIFDNIYVNMIRAAETGGLLTDILGRLSDLIDQEIDTKSRIQAATRYPMLAFLVLCAGFLIVVTFVIPRFAVIYGQFNAALPLPTRILIGTSVILKKFWYLFILCLGLAVFGFQKFIHSKNGRPLWDNFRLKVPVFGPLVTMLTMSRFARVTAVLMKSMVPILEILDLVADTSNNVIIRRAIVQIKESVNQGKGMSEPMKVSGLFPPIVVNMVATGEQTGRVDELLLSVSDYYDRESGYMIKNLTTYIEPILIFVLAVMVLVMALAIFMPMWNLIKVFRPG
jgi:type II secretory pathway component PulF